MVSARQFLTAFGSSASAFPCHSVPTIPHNLQLPTPLNLGHLVLKFCVWLAWGWVFDLLSQALFTDVNFLSPQCAVLSKAVLSSCPLSSTSVIRIQLSHSSSSQSELEKHVFSIVARSQQDERALLVALHWHFNLFATKAGQALCDLKNSTKSACVLAPVGSALVPALEP